VNVIIRNARIFNGKEFIRENTVEVGDDGIISSLSYTRNTSSGSDNSINLNGKILAPGFVDIHTHGGAGINSTELSGKAELEKISAALAKNGTTSALITGFYSLKGDNEHLDVIANFSKNLNGARVHGLYLEGPFVNAKKKGMIGNEYITESDCENVLKRIKKYSARLKIMTIAPENKCAARAAGNFVKNGTVIAFGHSNAGYKKSLAAFKGGYTHVTHLFNAMEGLHHRETGPLGALLHSKDVSIELIADGNHVHPAAVEIAYRLFGKERLVLITDSTGMDAMKDGKYYTAALGHFIIKDGSAYDKTGRLIGSNTSLIQMCRNVKKWLNLPLEDVLQMATFNPASVIKEKVGFIKAGNFGDFIITDGELKLYGVIIGGKKIV
jgi:N-acetylglucosamine-6-phosphate deacetylase